MAADAGVKAPVQGVREDMLPGPALRAGGRANGRSQTWRVTNKKAGTVPLTVPALQARFLLPCPPCASTTIGTFGRTLLLLFTPTEGVDENRAELAQELPRGLARGACEAARASSAVRAWGSRHDADAAISVYAANGGGCQTKLSRGVCASGLVLEEHAGGVAATGDAGRAARGEKGDWRPIARRGAAAARGRGGRKQG